MFTFRKTAGTLVVLVLPVLSYCASTPLAITNTIDVTAGGALSEPVQLHRPAFADWMADPDYNSWTNYTDASLHHEFPMITKLVWDTPENAIYLQNLCPGQTYEWAATNNGTVVKRGSFTTDATPPRWLIATVSKDRNIHNFRDLGGWELPGGNGKRTNFGVFFRSASFDAYFETGDKRDGNPMHAEFGINTELDLRGGENIATLTVDPSAGIEGERYYFEKPHGTVEEVIGLGPTNSFITSPSVKDGSVRYFRVEMIIEITPADSIAAKEIRKAFHVLGTKAYHPVLFHCAAGRDRTGYIAFLLEGLCGLREEQLYRDHLAIVFAAQNVMYSERLDGNIRSLYTARNRDGSLAYDAYGDSLAGHIRAYLESLGVTQEELTTITQAYTGETPDEVLARVNAYEAAEEVRTVWFVSRETKVTNAVHRVGKHDLLHPPLFVEDRHYLHYHLDRPGYTFTGWSEPKAVPGSTDICYEAQWACVNPGPGPGVSAWVYDAATLTVSDGEWLLGVSTNGNALTVLDVYAAPSEPGILDLSKPILLPDGTASDVVFARIGYPELDKCFFCTRQSTDFRGSISGLRLPDTVCYIGSFAFDNCPNLAGTLTLPVGVRIGRNAFGSCPGLTEIVFANSPTGGQVLDLTGHQFANSSGVTGSVTLPDGLTCVPTNLFSSSGISRIVLPESCTQICHSAFYRCKNLTNVVVGSQLKVLDYGAFNETSKLASFSPGFPTSLERLGEYALFGNSSLGGDLRLPHVDAIPYKCFTSVPMTSLYIPAVTNIGREAFNSAVLTNVTFGAKAVTFIDFHDANQRVGYSSFSKTAVPCYFLFPGKAPVMPKTGESADGGYTGTSGMFMSKAGAAILCGAWDADPAGWQKILTEIGTPMDAVTYAPPTVPAGWTVKGIFRYASSTTSSTYGWLVDCGSTGASVVVEGVTIPEAWKLQFPDYTARFGSDFAASLLKETGKKDAAGAALKVWHDYVMGTDPTDAADHLKALIEMTDGQPTISHTPDVSGRKYTVWGTSTLQPATWTKVPKGGESGYRFFKVSVEME